MSHFVVMREAGPGWAPGKAALDQPGVAEHSAFMAGLADDGFVLFAGPLAGTEQDRIRALVIVDAGDESEILERLSGDPWAGSEQLRTLSVEPWRLFVGAQRLARA